MFKENQELDNKLAPYKKVDPVKSETDFTTSVILAGKNEAGEKVQVNVVVDTVNRSSYLDVISGFKTIDIIAAKDTHEVITGSYVTDVEVSGVSQS